MRDSEPGTRNSERPPWRAKLALWLFQQLYTRLWWMYDFAGWVASGGQWRAWGGLALRHVQGPRVLELGYGPGHLLVALARAGYDVAGLDASPQMHRLAARRLRAASAVADARLGDARRLPWPAAEFDTVVATFPAPYLREPATLAEVRRVLRPGGWLVIVDAGRPAPATAGGRLASVAYRTVQGADPQAITVEMREHNPYALPGWRLTMTDEPVGRGVVTVFELQPEDAE